MEKRVEVILELEEEMDIPEVLDLRDMSQEWNLRTGTFLQVLTQARRQALEKAEWPGAAAWQATATQPKRYLP